MEATMFRNAFLVVSASIIAALTGCRTDDYRTRSILNADGSVERSIFQPVDDTPAPAQKAELWQSKEVVRHKNRDYFNASGKFAAVNDIPDALVLRRNTQNKLLAALMPTAKLARDYKKIDCVFVTDHRWQEKATDTVTIASLRQGREELTVLGIDLGEAVFNEVLGKDYDATELLKWLRSDGKAWLTELTDYAFMHFLARRDLAPQNVKDVPVDILNGLADICDRYGLRLRENGQFIMDEKKLAHVAENFAYDLVSQKVVRRDTKKPVDRETLAAWAAELRKEMKKADAKDSPGRFEVAALKVIKDKFGFKEVAEAKAGAALLKIAGVHAFGEGRAFDFDLTVPGPVVETNGTILAANRVSWHFSASDAWPFGYAMTCRVLEPQTKLQTELLKGEPLTSPETMLEFVKLMMLETPAKDPKAPNQPPTLLEVMEQCRAQKTLAPLHAHRRWVLKKEPVGGVWLGVWLEQVDQLYKLLKLEKPEG
jgi:hypothetical protein